MKKKSISSLVNLNVNPCKMCMPMGSVMAFYGIKKCMTILHGSQGCATYIRRHMATHYNEPVDVASSSLTEHGTVYGGEKNLIEGLKNLIELYQPEVIGVATTCLAETIGEDVQRIIYNFYEQYPEYKEITVIPVHTPGYGGTQFEGYMRTLCSILEHVPQNQTKHEKVNVIVSSISPRDARFLKEAFAEFGIDIILFPDVSDNLDGALKRNYERLPMEGTSIEEIKTMAGAKLTIELTNVNLEYSPGAYLQEEYGVPYIKLGHPIGLRYNDAFYECLSKISNRPMKEKIQKERGRLLDAMVDSHKYCGSGRATIFGEPDFVISTVRLCVENGVMPLVVATGGVCKQLTVLLKEEIDEIAKRYLINQYEILDDIDFKKIEEVSRELASNLLIGNSDGRRMEELLGIPLVRRGFPIHDRVGGQRLAMFGYEGTLTFLDDIANALLSREERNFRMNLYDKYYKQSSESISYEKTHSSINIEGKTKTHPCFHGCGSDCARMHLPVAPHCNIQCNYCVRKFDCPNESRPGVTTKVLTPNEALKKYKEVKERVPNLTVVGIAGPGDALANWKETKQTLQLIREYDPDVTFCLSTNGLMLPMYAKELVECSVTHVTVTVNAVDIKVGAAIYQYITYNGMKLEGEAGAAILIANQLSGLQMLVQMGVVCKVNIVTLKGINDTHIPQIVTVMKKIGVYITNIMPFIQVKGSIFENLPETSNKEINEIRKECSLIMKQMYHCRQCRADAIGTLDHDISNEFSGCSSRLTSTKATKKYRFAVASKTGDLVDEHFGHVTEFYIYECESDSIVLKERRMIEKYCYGAEDCQDHDMKIQSILKTIEDCIGVIVMRIGASPKQQLMNKGIKVFITFGKVEDVIKDAVESL